VATVPRAVAATVARLRVAAATAADRLRVAEVMVDLQAVDRRVVADSVGLRVAVDLRVMVDLLRVVDLLRADSVDRLRRALALRAASFRRAVR
jgi:hypothetical protein